MDNPAIDTPGESAPLIVTELPGPRSRELLARGDGVLYPGLSEGLAPFVVASKSGHTVTDVDGNVFVDLISASGSVPAGAARPELIDAAVAAMREVGNEDAHALTTPAFFDLAERLVELAPGAISRVDISLNGTESVETAIRMMRRATGRPMILGFLGGYHGESTTTAALGAELGEISQAERALVPGFFHAPYPHPYRSPFGPPRPGGSGDATIDYIRDHLLFHLVEPERVAGVVIEPILGSGGCVAPPPEFWPALRALCDEYGWLLCADEVKSGWGRAGAMLAVERFGVEPDLICLGKAMGGGVMPIGAVLGNEAAMGGYDDLSTGSTWSWLPGSVAAALATLELYEREDVIGNVLALEAVAGRVLAELAERVEAIGEVRAIGGFHAIELVRDRATRERDPGLQAAIAAELCARGVLVESSTTSLNIQPSLLMPPEDYEAALAIVAEVVSGLAEGGSG